MKTHPRILEALTTKPWLCTEEGVRQMVAIASYEGDIEALRTKIDARMDGAVRATQRGNVAIIPVAGPIFPKANLMTEISGATSLEGFAQDYQKALDNDAITSILIDFSTPGGVVDGIHEAANMIYNSTKKTVGYASSQAASAGYWMIAACDEVVLDATARLGSIGVVAGIAPKKEGDTLEFVNTASPNKRVDYETKEGQAVLIEELDSLADVFISNVATFRGVDEKVVRSKFGKGGVLIGQAAVDVGMADRLGSFEALVKELQNEEIENGGSNMDLTAVTKDQLKVARPDLVTAIMEETSAPLVAQIKSVEADLSAQLSALDDENSKLKAENAESKERIVALERQEAIRDAQMLEAQATTIMESSLAGSKIPKRLHAKVSASINKEDFVTDGKLDVAAYTAKVNSEVEDWEASLGESTLQGIGATSRTDGSSSSDDADDDAIVTRMLG